LPAAEHSNVASPSASNPSRRGVCAVASGMPRGTLDTHGSRTHEHRPGRSLPGSRPARRSSQPPAPASATGLPARDARVINDCVPFLCVCPDGVLPGEQRISVVAAACSTGGPRAPQRGLLAGTAVARRRRAGGLPIWGALGAGAPAARSRVGRAWHDPGHRVAGCTCGPTPRKTLARPSPWAHSCSGGAKQQSHRPARAGACVLPRQRSSNCAGNHRHCAARRAARAALRGRGGRWRQPRPPPQERGRLLWLPLI